MKHIFVTGGVVSGLGKGICAASLGRLLKQRGFRVKNQKFDPYFNVDPGLLRLVRRPDPQLDAGKPGLSPGGGRMKNGPWLSIR